MHPLLLPGTHVVRRGPDELQAGLDPSAAVVVAPPVPRTGSLLGALHEHPVALRTLRRAGLVLEDDAALRASLPAAGASAGWARHTLAAVARRAPARAAFALGSRSGHAVDVTPFGHPLSDALADDVRALCRRAALPLSGPARPGPPRRGTAPPRPVHVLVGVGEPSRELLDGWVRDAAPHLVVRLVEGRAVVGPFVVPGRTACLRCLDAYRTEEDPAWPLLVEQYSRATRTDRSDGIPEPVDAALAAVAVGWAVRELEAHAEGDRPASWSSTITVSSDLRGVTTRRWPAHPHCGCAWG